MEQTSDEEHDHDNDTESTPLSLEQSPIRGKTTEEKISPISQPPGDKNKMLPGAITSYNNRIVSNSSQPSSTDRLDYLEFGDPTFVSPGFLTPRQDSNTHPSLYKQSVTSRSGSNAPAGRTQHTLTSMHGTESTENNRTPMNHKVNFSATQVESSIPRSPLASVNKSEFNVSNLPPSSNISPRHHSRSENPSPIHHQSMSSKPTPGLVLEDFTVEYRDPRPKSSLTAVSNRFPGIGSRIGIDLSNPNSLPAGGGVIDAGLSTAATPTHGFGVSNNASARQIAEQPSLTSHRANGEQSCISRSLIHPEKLSPVERYDLKSDNFFPDKEDFVRNEDISRTLGCISPHTDRSMAVIAQPSSPSLRTTEIRLPRADIDTGRLQRGTSAVGFENPLRDAVFSHLGEMEASRTDTRGLEKGHAPTASLNSSPSHAQTPHHCLPSREQDALSPRSQVLNKPSPHHLSDSFVALASPMSPGSYRCQQELQAPTRSQNPIAGAGYSITETNYHLDPSTGTGEALAPCCGPDRDVELAVSPRSGRRVPTAMARLKARPPNGHVQSSFRSPRSASSRLWQRKSQQGEFSPLPTSSFSADEEEEEEEGIYSDNNEGIEMLEKGQRRSGSRQSSRSLRHCHQPKMAGNLTDSLARRQLIAVVVLCVIFMTGEAVGGVLANSLALFTDVLHLGSDLVSFVISLLAMWLANKPPTRRMTFGYHRAEVLGALLSVFIIWLVSGVLCYIAVERIAHEHYKNVRPNEMLITAALGVVINFIMGFVLHSEICCGHAHSHNKFGHGHSHGNQGNHSHNHSNPNQNHVGCSSSSSAAAINSGYDYADDKGLLDVRSQSVSSEDAFLPVSENRGNHYGGVRRQDRFSYQTINESTELTNVIANEDHHEENPPQRQQKNINVRAAFIHVVGDIIQSIGVFVAALIIKFTDDPKFRLADPICTFLFSLLVLITTVAVLRDTLMVMMEAVPRNLSLDTVRKDLLAVDGVVAVHSLHVWALTMDRNAISVHLAIGKSYLHDQVLSSALEVTQDRHHFFNSTIQVEQFDETRSQGCSECLEVE